MVTVVTSTAAKLNIRLGQTPITKVPELNYEMQGIYNALHILNKYMDLLRDELESGDNEDPSVSVRFRNRFESVALQKITAGDVVSQYAGGIVKGVGRNEPRVNPGGGNPSYYGTWGRIFFHVNMQVPMIALSDAEVDETVRVGVGPGIIEVPGIKCGTLVWGKDARSIESRQGVTNGTSDGEHILGQTLVGDGAIYPTNAYRIGYLGDLQIAEEGVSMPGFPRRDGDYVYKSRAFLYPIGVAVLDNFILLYDFKADTQYDTIGKVLNFS